jgi:hypothetical protein
VKIKIPDLTSGLPGPVTKGLAKIQFLASVEQGSLSACPAGRKCGLLFLFFIAVNYLLLSLVLKEKPCLKLNVDTVQGPTTLCLFSILIEISYVTLPIMLCAWALA